MFHLFPPAYPPEIQSKNNSDDDIPSDEEIPYDSEEIPADNKLVAGNEIKFIILGQKIKDKIAELENLREDWNYTVNAAEAKLTILNRLLQLITVPDVFTDTLGKEYFDGIVSTNVEDLIQKLLESEQFRNVHKDNKPTVTNRDILNSGMDVSKYQSNLLIFLNDISKEFGKIEIKRSPQRKPSKPIPEFKIAIKQINVFGDSLTDIDLMRNSKVGDYSGLKGNSPKGSFTNGYTWLGHLYNYIFNRSIIPAIDKHPNGKPHTDEDIDVYIKKRPEIKNLFQLKNEGKCNVFTINGEVVSRSYAIGGATADNYNWLPSSSITRYFTRLMVDRLEDQRNKFLADDASATPEEKRKKLIIEWTGANDLITVNDVPSLLEADNAVKARMVHLEELIKNGYTNFVLCNLPDLSLTPRYQDKKNKTDDDRENARLCTEHFNRQLELGVAELKKLYPHCNMDVCDVNTKFKAGIKGIIKGGDYAKPYKKYIDTEYKFEMLPYKDFPKHIDRNKFYLKFDNGNNLTYQVIDPCGQIRRREIKFADLVKNFDNSLSDDDRRQAIEREINKWLSTASLNKDSKLLQCILAITNENGDTLPEDDYFTPLKDTKAFTNFQKDLANQNPPKTIEDLGYFPGVNRLFFDDVHPSADMQRFLFDEINEFVEKKYHIETPKIDLPNKPTFPGISKDDLDIPTKTPIWSKLSNQVSTEKELVAEFMRKYHHQFNQARSRYFGWLRERNLEWTNPDISLEQIIKHAAESTRFSKNRTYKILQEMEWISEENGEIQYIGPKYEEQTQSKDVRLGYLNV